LAPELQAALSSWVTLPRGDVLLRADCYRFQEGARNHKGLGSMFWNVRGIYYLAHLLRLNTTVALNVPTTGHGGNFEATRRFLTGPRAPALAEDAATAVFVPKDVRARIGAWFEFGGASEAARLVGNGGRVVRGARRVPGAAVRARAGAARAPDGGVWRA
jgi:hypothetical protein